MSFVSETPEQTRELKIKDLDQAFKEAQAAESDFSKKKNEYQDKNIDAINRVIKIEQAGKGKPAGKDAEVQASWTKWRDDQHEPEQEGLGSPQGPPGRAQGGRPEPARPRTSPPLDSAIEATKEVTVTANVRTPDGQSTKKTLVLTLQRVVVQGQAGKEIAGKWMITGLKEGGGRHGARSHSHPATDAPASEGRPVAPLSVWSAGARLAEATGPSLRRPPAVAAPSSAGFRLRGSRRPATYPPRPNPLPRGADGDTLHVQRGRPSPAESPIYRVRVTDAAERVLFEQDVRNTRMPAVGGVEGDDGRPRHLHLDGGRAVRRRQHQ